MLSGDLYRADDAELVAERYRCRSLLRTYNEEVEEELRFSLLHQILGKVGAETIVRSPFACDYGYNISMGDGVFVNFNAVVCPGVTIGADTVIGAGSVVTRNIPAGVIAVGVPCRVLRRAAPPEESRHGPVSGRS